MVPVHGKCIVSQALRAEPGVLSSEVGSLWPTEADAQVLRQVRPTCGGIETSFKWRPVAPQVRL
jgi:hypothetical protein